MELGFYTGCLTPPIHFGRVTLYIWSSLLVSFPCDVCLGWYLRLLCSPNALLLVQYVVYVISLKTLGFPLARVHMNRLYHT